MAYFPLWKHSVFYLLPCFGLFSSCITILLKLNLLGRWYKILLQNVLMNVQMLLIDPKCMFQYTQTYKYPTIQKFGVQFFLYISTFGFPIIH